MPRNGSIHIDCFLNGSEISIDDVPNAVQANVLAHFRDHMPINFVNASEIRFQAGEILEGGHFTGDKIVGFTSIGEPEEERLRFAIPEYTEEAGGSPYRVTFGEPTFEEPLSTHRGGRRATRHRRNRRVRQTRRKNKSRRHRRY